MSKFHSVALLTAYILLPATFASAETVNVKYRGMVPLDDFQCPVIKKSSLVKRLCYDKSNSYLLVQLKSTYYHYCDVPLAAVEQWISAPSLGRHYNANFKGGPYGCQDKAPPQY